MESCSPGNGNNLSWKFNLVSGPRERSFYADSTRWNDAGVETEMILAGNSTSSEDRVSEAFTRLGLFLRLTLL